MSQPTTATVRITQRFTSARDGSLVDALTEAGWTELLARLDGCAPISVEPYIDARGNGVDVTVATMRGPGGAFSIHDLACRYGALAVVRR
jgi:hypothetical protein